MTPLSLIAFRKREHGIYMRLVHSLRLVSAVAVATAVLHTSDAFAQDPPATPVPEAGPRFRPFSLTINPLGLGILQRYGLNVEYMVAKHHGVWIYPFYTSFTVTVESSFNGVTSKSETTSSGPGGEIGYHFYTGEKGANGFYVGPTAGLSRLNSKASCTGCTTTESGSTAAHVGIDLGGQHVFDNGITLGGGGGLMVSPRRTTSV